MGTYRSPYGDTTYTKVFVGGLAWETPTEKMRDYFDQFGDILEAVIITDRFTGKSKGYGFVTYKDPEAARRACEDPNPMIDGRRANCNIASFGRPKPSPPRGKIQGGSVQAGPSQASSSSSYGGMPPPQHTLPSPFYYSPYGYPTYPPYGYAQGVYNQQVQQAQQYYAAQYYGNVVPSPNTYTSSAVNPYYYGYTRGGLPTTPAHGMNVGPSYVYYPTAQIERPTSFPPLISSSSSATRLYPPSPSEPRDQRSTATDTEAGGPNWKAPIT